MPAAHSKSTANVIAAVPCTRQVMHASSHCTRILTAAYMCVSIVILSITRALCSRTSLHTQHRGTLQPSACQLLCEHSNQDQRRATVATKVPAPWQDKCIPLCTHSVISTTSAPRAQNTSRRVHTTPRQPGGAQIISCAPELLSRLSVIWCLCGSWCPSCCGMLQQTHAGYVVPHSCVYVLVGTPWPEVSTHCGPKAPMPSWN
jgi:hypothetical protein